MEIQSVLIGKWRVCIWLQHWVSLSFLKLLESQNSGLMVPMKGQGLQHCCQHLCVSLQQMRYLHYQGSLNLINTIKVKEASGRHCESIGIKARYYPANYGWNSFSEQSLTAVSTLIFKMALQKSFKDAQDVAFILMLHMLPWYPLVPLVKCVGNGKWGEECHYNTTFWLNSQGNLLMIPSFSPDNLSEGGRLRIPLTQELSSDVFRDLASFLVFIVHAQLISQLSWQKRKEKWMGNL